MGPQGAYGPPGAELQRLYDADAVDRYIAQLQSHIETLQAQAGEAVRLAAEAQEKAAAAGKTEALLGRAMLSAQQAADQAITDAHRHAELIVAEARREADRLLADVRADAQRIVDEAHQTVEAVFAALNARREPEAPPEPEAAPVMFPPPVAPPPAMWAAPDPATREPDDTDDVWGPPATAAWDDAAPESEGTIVDLRPGRPAAAPARPEPDAPEPSAGSDWALSLGGTGTDGRPLPAPAAAPEARPAGAELLDRWRLARNGPGVLDDEFVSRQRHLDSLADGSYVSLLRGDSATGGLPRGEPPEPTVRRFGLHRRPR